MALAVDVVKTRYPTSAVNSWDHTEVWGMAMARRKEERQESLLVPAGAPGAKSCVLRATQPHLGQSWLWRIRRRYAVRFILKRRDGWDRPRRVLPESVPRLFRRVRF